MFEWYTLKCLLIVFVWQRCLWWLCLHECSQYGARRCSGFVWSPSFVSEGLHPTFILSCWLKWIFCVVSEPQKTSVNITTAWLGLFSSQAESLSSNKVSAGRSNRKAAEHCFCSDHWAKPLLWEFQTTKCISRRKGEDFLQLLLSTSLFLKRVSVPRGKRVLQCCRSPYFGPPNHWTAL